VEIGVGRAAYRGADERQSSHPVRMSEGEIDGHLTTHRTRHHDGALKASRVENRYRVADRRPAILALLHHFAKTPRINATHR